jgi:integrase
MPRGRPNQGPKLVLLEKKGWREGVWYIRWSEAGRSHERTTGTGDRGRADQVFARWLIERGRSLDEPARAGPRYPAEAGIAEMLAIYGAQHAPELADPARVGQCIKRLLAWWGDRRVDAVRPETCRQYRRTRVRDGAKIATAAKELSVLRAALNYAQKNGYLTAAPFVELPPRQPGRDRWLTRSEAARLLWESRREPKARLHLPLFVLIALYTGARRGAVLGLRWSQIDLVRGRIDFNEPSRPRTNKRRPIIPVPRGLLWFLRKAHQRATSTAVIAYDGEAVKRIRRSFRAACRRAGLADVTPHALRHTAGTWMAQRGVDLHQIAGWLGHSYERTTELYLHHHPDYLDDAKRAMERR